jgi:hypothetical protein
MPIGGPGNDSRLRCSEPSGLVSLGIDGADAGSHALGYLKSRQIAQTRAKNHDLLITNFTNHSNLAARR